MADDSDFRFLKAEMQRHIEWLRGCLSDWSKVAKMTTADADEYRYEMLSNLMCAADEVSVAAPALRDAVQARNHWTEADIERIRKGVRWPPPPQLPTKGSAQPS
jgi:hypothetical protein